MMRAAHALQREGYDPRLLFLSSTMSNEQFITMLENYGNQ